MKYTRRGRKKSNRRTQKVLTHLPLPLFRSIRKVQQGGGKIWQTFGEFLVNSVVGVGNDGRAVDGKLQGSQSIFVVTKVDNNNGLVRTVDGHNVELGFASNISRGVDSSGNVPFNIARQPLGDYSGISYCENSVTTNMNNNTVIQPAEGGEVSFRIEGFAHKHAVGDLIRVVRNQEFMNQSFIGTLRSVSTEVHPTNGRQVTRLVVNNIRDIRGAPFSVHAQLYRVRGLTPFLIRPTLFLPSKIAVDSAGNIFIVEDNSLGNQTAFRVFSTSTNTMTSYGRFSGQLGADNQPNESNLERFSVYQNLALAVDKKTDVGFIADLSFHTIRSITQDNGLTISGKNATIESAGVKFIIRNNNNDNRDGNQDRASFRNPTCIAIDPKIGRGYVADSVSLMMIDMRNPGNITVPGISDRYYVSTLWEPPGTIRDMVVDNSGNLFVLCGFDSQIMSKRRHAIWKIVPPPQGTVVGYNRTDWYGRHSTVTFTPVKAIFPKTGLPQAPPAGQPRLIPPELFAGHETSDGYVDGMGTNARFRHPMGISVDSKNILYIADVGNNVIRCVRPNAEVFTLAGTGEGEDLGGDKGDRTIGDGEASTARFSTPVSVAVDHEDNIYVLDRGLYGKSELTASIAGQPPTNQHGGAAYTRIRKLTRVPTPSAPQGFTLVSTDSISATFSWSGGALTGFEDKGLSASFQFLIKPSATSPEVSYAIDGTTPYLPNNRAATPTKFITNNVSGANGFYTNNLLTLPLTPATTYSSIKLVAFNNTGQSISAPLTTVVTPQAAMNYTIYKSGTVGTSGFANGPPLSSLFANPKGMVADANNSIYVADTDNHCIRMIDAAGTTSTFFGTPGMGGADLTRLNSPGDVTFSNGGVWPMYIADQGNNRVLSVTSAGVGTVFGKPDQTLQTPASITVDIANNVYVSSTVHCIYRITPAGDISIFAGAAGVAGFVDGPAATARFHNGGPGLHYDTKNACLYLADTYTGIIRKIVLTNPVTVTTVAGRAQTGGTDNGLGSVARFYYPMGITTDSDGVIYVCDYLTHTIRKISPAGLVSTHSGVAGTPGAVNGTARPTSYNTNNSTSTYRNPCGICTGARGLMFISETGSNSIRVLSPFPPPTAPTTQTFSAVTINSATITWAGDSGATSYSFSITPSSQSIVIPTVNINTKSATFTGLTESTEYTIVLILNNDVGSTFSPPIKFFTMIDTSTITLQPAITKGYAVKTGEVSHQLFTAVLSWTGLTRVPLLQYTVTSTTGTQTPATVTRNMPANQRSPFILVGLAVGSSYTVRLTGILPNFSTPITGVIAPHSAASNELSFSITQSIVPRPIHISTIAGLRGTAPTTTTATTTPSQPSTTQLNTIRAIAQDDAGNIYLSSVTCILKLTPPANRSALYDFNTNEATPTPIPIPNTVNGISGYTVTLFAGSTTQGAPSRTMQTGAAIRFQNISAMIYSKKEQCLYVSEAAQAVIVKVTVSGIPTAIVIAGTVGHGAGKDGLLGVNMISACKGLVEGPDGTLFICDFNFGIRRLDIVTGNLTTISAIGNDRPNDIVIFPDGSLYYSSGYDHTIRRLRPNPMEPGKYINTIFAGASQPTWSSGAYVDGPLLTARFNGPQGLTVDANYNMYVYDSNNYAIRLITSENVYTIMGSGRQPPLSSGNTDGVIETGRVSGDPGALAWAAFTALFSSPTGSLYLPDYRNGTLRLITDFPASNVITEAQLDYYKTSGAQASSARAYTASSALAQSISGAQASSATAQVASQAVASSALQLSVLSGPVSVNKAILSEFQAIKADLAAQIAVIYSASSSSGAQAVTLGALRARMSDLEKWLQAMAASTVPIFAIAPMYQDRDVQFLVQSPYLQSVGSRKLYDIMRKACITIDSTTGHIIPNIEVPSSRPFVSGQRRAIGTGFSPLSTDMLLAGDLTIPSPGVWKSYFDLAALRYFYVDTSNGRSQYDHPFPPVFSSGDQILTDVTTNFLPAGFIKLYNIEKKIPYYLNLTSTETVWHHPAPPPPRSQATLQVDATLFPAYTKYISKVPPTTGKAFYVSSVTFEPQWDFPDLGFNDGPSTAYQASSALAQVESRAQASSARAQVESRAQASSAVAQVASSARAYVESRAQASSAVAQVASSAVQQRESSAQQQTASSSLQQRESSAQHQVALAEVVAVKDKIRSDMREIQSTITELINRMNGNGPSTADTTISQQVETNFLRLAEKKLELLASASSIFEISPDYQDTTLQTIVNDDTLSSFGIKKVFDTLRNRHIFLNGNNTIVQSPLTPMIRSYTSSLQRGGNTQNKKSRKSSILLYRV